MGKEQLAVTRYYFTLYMPSSVVVTYLPIWLETRGLTGSQIGAVNTLPMALVLLFSVFFGRLADRAKDWKQAILIGHGLALLFVLPLFGVQSFWPILLIWTLTSVPAGLAAPVADAAAMRLALRRGFSFGTVRGWGTVGYVAFCFIAGWVIAGFGDGAFVWMLLLTVALRFYHSWTLPVLREAGAERPSSRGGLLSAELFAALRPWVLLPLIGAAMIFGTHMVMNAFSSLAWRDQGIGAGTIGALVAFGGMAEAVSMFLWGRVQKYFSARTLIALAAAVSALRWAAMAFSPPVWGLFVLQALQAVTFTFGFLGALYFIANRTEEKVAAEAQSLFGVMQQASSVVIVLLFGLLWDRIGPTAFFASAAIALCVLPLIRASFRLQARDEAAEE